MPGLDFISLTAALRRRTPICVAVGIVAFSAGLLTCSPAASAEPKKVMLLHSFGRDFRPWSEYARAIREDLKRRSPWSLDITEHSLVNARFADTDAERPLADYLRALYAKQGLDLIVSLGAPAAGFVQRYREQLFATTPMVFTAVEQRRVQFTKLTANDAVVAVAHDLPAVIANILFVLPSTKRVLVVNGNSPLEQFWLEEMRRELKLFESRVALTWTNKLSFDDVLKQAATLPPDSAIFWELMIVDAAGVVHEGDSALRRLHAVAKAPIFSFDDSFFGRELVGGPMHSVTEISRRTADVAIRVLRGEQPSDVKTKPIGFAAAKFDGRELKRWGISDSHLPPGSVVYFRSLTTWERYRPQILAIIAAFLIQSALVSWLLYEHRRRHTAEISARNTMSELTHMNRRATAGELSASIAHEINQPLTSITVGADAALNWLSAKTPNLVEVRSALVKIREAGHRAGDVIKNLRAMFRNGGQDKNPFDVNTAIDSVLALVRSEIKKHDIEVQTQLGNNLPLVNGIETQFQQVVLNLIVNAIEAMDSSPSPARYLRVVSEAISPDSVQVSIEDSGTGVAPTDLQRVFQPMFTTKTSGMGMGLAICHSIVQAHGGRIWVTPGRERGSIFHVALPANEQSLSGIDRTHNGAAAPKSSTAI